MKHESEYGLGEICGYLHDSGPNRRMSDVLVKVIGICFEADGAVRYTVEHSGPGFGVQRFIVCAESLDGDPDYDQELGKYPDKCE